MRSTRPVAAVILIVSLTTAGMGAQAPAGLVTLPLPPDGHVSGITVSIARGIHFPTEGVGQFPTTDVSVQVPIREPLVIEGEVRRASADSRFSRFSRIIGGLEYGSLHDTPCAAPECVAFLGNAQHASRDFLNIGANLLYRAGTPRVASFFGAGLGIQRTTGQFDTVLTCEPKVTGGCGARQREEVLAQHSTGIGANVRAIYGVELVVAPRLSAFATFRLTNLVRPRSDDSPSAGFGMTAGMRVAATTRSVPLAAKEVRVTEMNGVTRVGRLMMASNTEVILRHEGRDVHVLLADIRKVETISHHALIGGLIGSALSAAIWALVATTRDSCADCEDGPQMARLLTGLLIGGGAGIGAAVNAATRDQHLLYLGRRPSSSVVLKPVLSPNRAALDLAWQW